MGIARRQFLQTCLASLVGWQFLSRDRVAFAAEQYVRQATTSTQRKRALLIGINQYDAKDDTQNFSPSRYLLYFNFRRKFLCFPMAENNRIYAITNNIHYGFQAIGETIDACN